MSWPALDGRISTGAGGELLSTTSTESKHTVAGINSIQLILLPIFSKHGTYILNAFFPCICKIQYNFSLLCRKYKAVLALLKTCLGNRRWYNSHYLKKTSMPSTRNFIFPELIFSTNMKMQIPFVIYECNPVISLFIYLFYSLISLFSSHCDDQTK